MADDDYRRPIRPILLAWVSFRLKTVWGTTAEHALAMGCVVHNQMLTVGRHV
jgi:hypothetical protein